MPTSVAVRSAPAPGTCTTLLCGHRILPTSGDPLTFGVWDAPMLSASRRDVFLVFCGHDGPDSSDIGSERGLAASRTALGPCRGSEPRPWTRTHLRAGWTCGQDASPLGFPWKLNGARKASGTESNPPQARGPRLPPRGAHAHIPVTLISTCHWLVARLSKPHVLCRSERTLETRPGAPAPRARRVSSALRSR